MLKNSPGFVKNLSVTRSLTTLKNVMNILNPPPNNFLVKIHHGSKKFFQTNLRAPGIAPINFTSCATFSLFLGSPTQSKILYRTNCLNMSIKNSKILPRPFCAAFTTGFFLFLPFFALLASCFSSSSSLFSASNNFLSSFFSFLASLYSLLSLSNSFTSTSRI